MAEYLELFNECTDPGAGDFLHIYDASAPSNDKDRKVAWPIESGTWTPTVEGSTTPGSPSYNVQVGRYVKVGSLVVAWFNVELTNKSTMSGAVNIGGLPYTIRSAANFAYAGSISYFSNLASNVVNVGIHSNNNTKTARLLRSTAAAGTISNMTDSDLNNNSRFTGMIAYEMQ